MQWCIVQQLIDRLHISSFLKEYLVQVEKKSQLPSYQGLTNINNGYYKIYCYMTLMELYNIITIITVALKQVISSTERIIERKNFRNKIMNAKFIEQGRGQYGQ